MASESSSDIELKVLHANTVVNHVVRTLQAGYHQHSGKKVSEVVVGGSLGQGTTVPGNFDVDLVLLSEDITPHEMLDTLGAGARLVRNLQKFLQRQLGVEVEAKVKKELLLITFSLPSREYDIVVDVDLGLGPLWRDVRDAADFISQLKSKHESNWVDYRRLFSPAVAKWEMEYIKRQPNRVKELIRRAKRWQKEQWTSSGDDGKPKSYLIGILMSEACRRWCVEKGWDVDELHNHMSPTTFDEYVLGVQRIFTNMVVNHRQLCFFNSPWFDGVPNERYGNPDKKAGQPFILDPANPFDNLYDSAVKPYAKGRARGDTHNWGAFVEKIGTLDLTRSLYENLGIDLKVMEVIVHALKNPRKPAQYHWLSQMTINSIHEGGSLHKGTTVPGDVEVDLVILSRNVTVQMMESSVMSGHSRSDMKDIMNELQLFLSRSLPQKYHFTIEDTLVGSFSFSVTDDNTVVKIDLFIAPYFETLDAAKDTMRDFKKGHEDRWDEFRTLFAPSVAEWQTEYIKKQPGRVKELMKRVKQWKKGSRWAKGTPSSYLLEILVLMACRKYCEKKGFVVDDLDVSSVSMDDIASGVQIEFVAMVTEYENLRLKPPQCEGHVWTSGPGRWNSCDVDDPYVMDPASSYNNLFISGMKGRDHMAVWREFASKVNSLDLKRQLNPVQ